MIKLTSIGLRQCLRATNNVTTIRTLGTGPVHFRSAQAEPVEPNAFKPKRTLHREIQQRINISGPMTVAEYMKLVLTNPLTGFYMSQDVFGSKGHFTTSPEISQIFGELVAVWLVNEWQRVGSPKPFRIIELGPGRGTLADDISRVLAQFNTTRDNSSLHLVEISPHLTQIQERTICGTSTMIEKDRGELHNSLSKSGIPVSWYKTLEQVPEKTGFNAFVAHEFFDALPIHKFQKNEQGDWREILIDLGQSGSDDLRYIMSRNPTPASKIFVDPKESRSHIEVCPQAAVITNQILDRINKFNGCFLICDYGFDDQDGSMKVKDTFRAFKNHQIWDPLKEAGTADLTADVDFGYLRQQSQNKALVFGPVAQEHFLRSLGIDIRLQKLLEKASSEEEKNDLRTGVNMIVNEMGQRFKFMSMFPKANRDLFNNNPPAGFL